MAVGHIRLEEKHTTCYKMTNIPKNNHTCRQVRWIRFSRSYKMANIPKNNHTIAVKMRGDYTWCNKSVRGDQIRTTCHSIKP